MNALIKKLLKYIEEEDVKGIIRFCLILLPFVGAAIGGAAALVTYITRHKEALILIGIALCMVIPALMGKKQEKDTPCQISVNTNVDFFDRILVKTLFSVFTTCSPQFQTMPPVRYSDLHDDLPSGMDLAKGVAVYRFKVISDGSPIASADFHEILTCHIEERLASGELPLGKPTAEFNGQLFPKVFIDECLCAGGVWHIALLICDNENVVKYINQKRQTLIMRNARISAQYDDCDF